ncbi:transglutaminase domain-containing protein [Paenibacillus sp. Marseille-Q4541]|uniref:transglutaminase domain-containing protein n=1 Tax=Paenibacillus sp. Marseille-Q4541 TaxID=2831522 RepID=UPI001BA54AAB|nr:transglutaminase domain-containing protein [Paenibacillus sp. Marseille-Q4541]
MRKNRFGLLIVVLLGVVMLAGIPRAVDLDTLYAASTEKVVTSESMHTVLTTAMLGRTESVKFTYKGKVKTLKSTLQNAIEEAMASDPYIQYNIKSYAYHYKGNNVSAEVNIDLKYRESKTQTAYVERRVKEILQKIITPEMNAHEKVEAIHDWIVLHLAYDESLQKYTAYDGLATGSTVCQGYSLLAYKMLEESGIENRIVEGQAGGQLHAWNLVLLDGKWYHLDATWDDPTPNQPGKVSYNYYLLTDQEMAEDHTWQKKYPAATQLYRDTLGELQQQNDGKIEAYDRLYRKLDYVLYNEDEIIRSSADLKALVKETIKEEQKTVLFRYSGERARLTEALKDLYSLGLESISYYVSDFEDTGDAKVKVSWNLE